MKIADLTGFLSRPAKPRRAIFLDLGRTGLFVFGTLVATGALLSLYYQPSPDAAHESLVHVTNAVSFGWIVRSLHRIAGHVMVLLVGIYVLRGYFKRLFLRPRGPAAWRISVALGFVCLGFLLTGEALPWNQSSYWQTVVNTNLLAEIPLAGPWLAGLVRGGDHVTGGTVVRLFVIHAVLLPWAALGLLVLARDLRKSGDMP